MYKKLVSLVIILSFLYSNSLWALAPDSKLDDLGYARVIAVLSRALQGRDVSLPQNLGLRLDPKDKVLYIYSKNPGTEPDVVYRVYTSDRTPPAAPSRPTQTENIGKLRIEMYPRTREWDEKIGVKNAALGDEETALLREFIDLLEELLPKDVSSILEINTRAWGKRFKDIDESDLRSIKDKGIDTIWLMGIWETSPESARLNKGVGSAYAIMDYVINPDLGTEEDFIEFSDRAKKMGLRVVVDFIPNHMAMDSPWIDGHPEWFMPWWDPVGDHNLEKRSAKGSPYFYRHPSGRFIAYGSQAWEPNDPWVDTAQLNLANAGLRQYLIATLKKIARLTQTGGVRCDMAMLATKAHIKGMWFGFTSQEEFDRLMPQEFWAEVINEVRKEYPDFKFIAEAYWEQEESLQQLGFDLTYDKYFYDLLVRGDIKGLKDYLKRAPVDYLAKTVHFLANHDERNPLDVFRDTSQHQAAIVLQGSIPGRLLYYQDEIEGKKEFSTATSIPSVKEVDAEVKRFYSRLTNIFSQAVYRKGDFYLPSIIGEEPDNVFVCQRLYQGSHAISVVNYSSENTSVSLEPEGLELEGEYLWADLTTGDKRLIKGREIKEYGINLSPWGYHIITLVPVENVLSQELEDLRARGLIGLKPRGPPENQIFYGYTNDVPEVVMGSILKLEAGGYDFSPDVKTGAITADSQAELEQKTALETAHFNYVMDYFIIPYYERAEREADSAGDREKTSRYNAYIMVLSELRTKIAGGELFGVVRENRIEKERRTAVSLLLELYEKEVKKPREETTDERFIGMYEEFEFLIMEIIEHLQEKVYISESATGAEVNAIIDEEIIRFNEVFAKLKAEFSGQDGILGALIPSLETNVPALIRDKKYRVGRAIFEIVEKMDLAGDNASMIKRFVDRIIEELEVKEPLQIEGDVILVCSNVPHPLRIEKLNKRLGEKVRIKAVLCDKGTPLSHFSIFASQEGITAVTGVRDNKNRPLFKQINDGEPVVVSGFNGKVIRNPSQDILAQLPRLILEERASHEYVKDRMDKDVITGNGIKINIYGNADRPHQIKEVMKSGGQGIGLVRTEYLYDREGLPSVEGLVSIFKTLAVQSDKDNKVVIRLFDKQPDKRMPCLPESQWTGFQYYVNDKAGRQAGCEG